ncbi:hypothetical protein Droror1_Dr00000537 [Drosera rotundifolia]
MEKNGSSSSTTILAMRTAIWVSCMVIFIGYFMMWIMMPTMVYKMTWLPDLRAKLNSTYYGTQGPNLLVYTFPVLLVAVAGSIYLHLGKQASYHGHEREGGEKSGTRRWRQPVVVRGPLGIVSGIELGFLLMFIALLVWSYTTYLHVGFSQISPAQIEEDGGKLCKARLDSAALRLGLLGNICLSFLFFPVTRASSILPLFGLTSEGSIKYHIWLGHLTMLIFTTHGTCYIVLWGVTDSLSEILKWQHVGVANVPGELALLAGLCMWATTFPLIRRKFFELFFYIHYLYILFVFFFILHVGIAYACIMLPGFYLFMIDRFLRYLQSRSRVRLVSARVLPCEVMELNFSKSPGLSYTPTSIVFVNVPSISKFQWHPFTISSSSSLEQDKLSVVMKVEGSWTRKLHEKLTSSSIDHLEVSLEGPYGPASTHFLRHDTLVMVAGGSGITPFISMIRELIHLKTELKWKIPKLLLITAFKKSSDLSMLDLLLPISGIPADISDLELQIEAYVTRDKEQPTNENIKELQTIGFKPTASDAPISPILGKNGWLWLAAIISSSFVAFLLFMGILTRFYIYPIDHNTNKIFSSSTRSVLNILLICICIAGTSSLAVNWTKKRNATETTQINHMEGMSPRTTPESYASYGDGELESLPHQSIVQSTNIHYGERPDLKKLLFDCKGTSIGVLVCGPKSMRHEVATICSSGLAKNLHFEAISFSW